MAAERQNNETNDRNFWMVGYKFGGTQDQLNRFLENKIWEGRVSDTTQNKYLQNVKKNDILILKTSFVKGQARNISTVRLVGLAIVQDVHKESYGIRCDVSYMDIPQKEFEKPQGSYRNTISLLKDPQIKDYVMQYLAPNSQTLVTQTLAAKYADLLRHCKNLVLTGAPGTGKTHLAREIAKAMNPTLSDAEQKATIGFVQFHPSYDYVDFVEGLRPTNGKNGVAFERRDGIFKDFCKKAKQPGDAFHSTPIRYVFIIDEINRGDLSKIFGELFFAIDPGYRGKDNSVQTQYQSLLEDDDEFYNGFYVPENVYIIGTMNDIDRSVESMDFALRRRFAWKKVAPEDTADAMGLTPDTEPRKRMEAINKEIRETEGLGPDYQIGGAYFLKLLHSDDFDAEALWQYHLDSLIGEYLRGFPNAKKIHDKIKKAYDDAGKKAYDDAVVNGEDEEN